MQRSFTLENERPGRYSAALQSLYQLEGEIALTTEAADTRGLYGHTVLIQTGNVSISNTDLDVEFDIPFDDDAEANEAEILIYNLSDLTIQNILKGQPISVIAGYHADTGVVFNGLISSVKTKRSGVDKVTQIFALDCEGRTEQEIESIAYAANTAASVILRDLLGRLGLPLAVFAPKRDYLYKDGKTISGGLMENIKKQAQVCGVSAYICKGQVYVRSVLEGDGLDFTLQSSTGLLDLTEFEETLTAQDFSDVIHGIEATCLLQHRIATGSILMVKSREVSGAFRVREGKHSYDGDNFLTKVKAIACPAVFGAEEGKG